MQQFESVPAFNEGGTAKRAHRRTHVAAHAAFLARENTILFAGFLGLYTLAAYYLTILIGAHHNDTVARTALGYFVMYGRDPHLSSIGFVWTPLMSLLQIPLVMALHWFGMVVFAGPLLGAVFGAAILPLFNTMAHDAGVGRLVRLPVIVLYALHPTIMLYTAAGMSEIVFFFFMVLTTQALLRWTLAPTTNTPLVIAGISTALAFWTRYEALPMMLAVGAMLVVVCWAYRRGSLGLFRTSCEATLLVVLTPVVFSIGLWMFFNWMIMHDPLFWISGAYSNIAFTQQFRSGANPVFHHVLGATLYALRRVQLQFVLFPLLVALALGVAAKRRSLLPTLPLFIPLALLVFHMYQSYSGTSYGWYRFFTYIVPGAIAAFFWVLRFLPGQRVWRSLCAATMIAGLLGSMLLTVRGMSDPTTGPEEHGFIQAIRNRKADPAEETRSFAAAKAVAAYLDQHAIQGPILVDTFLGYPVVVFARHPEQFVKTQDSDFYSVLHDPRGYGVRWILAPRPGVNVAPTELVLQTYPDLWNGGVPWAKQVADFGYWGLFEVRPPVSAP